MQRSSMLLSTSLSALLFCFAGLFFHVHAHAQDASTAVSWEALCAVSVCRGTGHDGVFAARFSPDGRQLAVDVRRSDKSGLYLVDRDEETRFWTQGHSAAWLANGSGIVFVHDNDLWSIEVGANSAKRLTNDEADVRAPRPSPNGDKVVFASGRSGHQDLWLVAVDGSAPPQQLTKGAMPQDETRFAHSWSPDGSTVAYYSNRTDTWSNDLWLVDVEDQEEKQLTKSFMGLGDPSWSPDGLRIAAFGAAKSAHWYTEMSDLFIIDTKNGTAEALSMQITAREPGAPAWSGDGSELFFSNHSRGEVTLWRLPAAGGVATRMSQAGGLIHDWDQSPQGDEFALVRSTPTRGKEIDLLATRGGSLTQLTQFASNWSGLVVPEEISYRSWDGLYIQAFIFRPPGFDVDKTYPVVVQVHGGGTHSYYNGLNLVEQRLAQQGYVVFAVNYRGGSGFGRRFQDLSKNDWANGQALDAAAAADYIRAQPWSSGKVGIYGYSYGGIISLAAIARAPDAFDAAVPMAGIYDFASSHENAERLIQLWATQGHGGSPQERPEIYAISNTISRLNAVKTPVLLMHGESDTIAPFEQYQQAVAELKRHGKVLEAHSYAGEPHRFRDPANRVDMYRRLEAWMDRWLKQPPQKSLQDAP
jgi:dipeptidyl aminopeptidase/acylaminoacyl peptidase